MVWELVTGMGCGYLAARGPGISRRLAHCEHVGFVVIGVRAGGSSGPEPAPGMSGAGARDACRGGLDGHAVGSPLDPCQGASSTL